MNHSMFNHQLLEEFDPAGFVNSKPFPWFNIHALLTPEAFQALCTEYPPLTKFERHDGMKRAHNQRPHNRYYLSYENPIYEAIRGVHRDEGEGIIRREELSPSWQAFMNELETDATYRAFITRLLGVSNFAARYAWHVGVTRSEVSPHRDADAKIGTHIFYFNTSEDWDPAWGGSTLVLAGKKVPRMNPDFSAFEAETQSQIVDNHSFLFKNTEDAWHGVRPLTCPEGRYRRLFNVIFEYAEAEKKATNPQGKSLVERLGRKLSRLTGKP